MSTVTTLSEEFMKKYEIESVDCSEKDYISKKQKELSGVSFYYHDYAKVLKNANEYLKDYGDITSLFEVRANDDLALLELLSLLKFGFKCHSSEDVIHVRSVSSNTIVMGNPIISSYELKLCSEYKIDYFVVDSRNQIDKIKEFFPTAKIILYLRAESPDERFGVTLKQAHLLMNYSKIKGLEVKGVEIYLYSDEFFDEAYEILKGISAIFRMHKIKFDILLSNEDSLEFLDDFPKANNYFVSLNSIICESFMTSCESISSVKVYENTKEIYYYFKNTDLFLGQIYNDMPDNVPSQTLNDTEGKDLYKCYFFGPTCDSSDCVTKEQDFIKVNPNDYITFENVGCFSSSYEGSLFNGFDDSYTTMRIFNKNNLN